MSGPALLHAALAAYAVAGLLALPRPGPFRAASIALSSAGVGLHVVFTVNRAVATGFLPFASRFEALCILALAVEAAGLGLFIAEGRRGVKTATDALGVIALVGALTGFGYAAGGGLNPILNSPWFAVHILLAFGGYGTLVAGLAWAVGALFSRRDGDEAVSRRLAALGALLLGAGITTGALWADVSWSRFWSWDPKETWALATWLCPVLYLHLGRGRRRTAALLFGLAVALMLFTFIGINLLKFGLHRY